MKTVLYILITIMIFGTVAARYSNNSNKKYCLLIQSVDSNKSSVILSSSAKIISKRLKDFSSDKFDIKIFPDKNQIQILLTDKWDLKSAQNLILHKGSFALYETLDRKNLSHLLNGNDYLFSLLKVADDSSAKIGFISFSQMEIVNNYLNSLGLEQKCKFMWEQSSVNSELCLFALKSDTDKGQLLTGTDIESVNYNQETTSKNYFMEIRFRKSATEMWADATKRNINKSIAIVLDNTVISAPVVKTEIKSGICRITGNYTESQVKVFAALFKNGELPISFKVVN
jgi:SecD/SecF fusion protein